MASSTPSPSAPKETPTASTSARDADKSSTLRKYSREVERIEREFQEAIRPFREVYNEETKIVERKYARSCLEATRIRQGALVKAGLEYKKDVDLE